MAEDELLRLVRGVGWHINELPRNFYVGSILEALFSNWRIYLLFPGKHGWLTGDDVLLSEEIDALEACLSLAVTSLRVPELDDGATRMRNLCARVRAMPRPPQD